jgi:hypothetical protein
MGHPMDALSFFASVIKTLAWPAVVAYLLYLLKGNVGRIFENLADRVTKLKVPGGEAEFSKELAKAREKEEELVIEEAEGGRLASPEVQSLAAPIKADDPYVALAKASPEAAIIEAFKELERLIVENRALLTVGVTPAAPGSIRRNLAEYVDELHRGELISREVVDQFRRVRELRNIAAHESGHPDISVGAAIEYRELCLSLAAAFTFALVRLHGLYETRPLGTGDLP